MASRQRAILGQMGQMGNGLMADPGPSPQMPPDKPDTPTGLDPMQPPQPGPDTWRPGPVTTDPGGDIGRPGPTLPGPYPTDPSQPGPVIPGPYATDPSRPGPIIADPAQPPDVGRPGPIIQDPAQPPDIGRPGPIITEPGTDPSMPGPVIPGPYPADQVKGGTPPVSYMGAMLNRMQGNPGEAGTLPDGSPAEVPEGGGTASPTAPAPNNGTTSPDATTNTAPAPGSTPPATTNAPGRRVTLLGFDSDKLEDPNSGSVAGSKYTPAVKAFYQGLKQDVGLSRGGLGNMVNYLKSNGFGNAREVGDDKIDFGDGNGAVDVIRSDGQIVFQNTTGNPTWEGQNGGGGQPGSGGSGPAAPAPVGSPTPGGGGGGAPAPAPTPTTTNPATSAANDALSKRIMELLNQDTTNVSPTDANLLPQVNAGRLAAQRAADRARAMAVERRHASGVTGGAVDSDIERAEQGRGEMEAANESGLVANELQTRRTQLQQAMAMQAEIESQDKNLAQQTSMQDKDISLRDRLAQLDAAIRNSQIQQQGQLGNRGMDLQDSQFWGQLGQNNQQFQDTLGFNTGVQNSNNYYRWLMAGLGGG